MLAESKLGTQSQSTAPSGAISAPVWQLERKAYSAIGGNGEGAAALCGRLSVATSTAVIMRTSSRLGPPTGVRSPVAGQLPT